MLLEIGLLLVILTKMLEKHDVKWLIGVVSERIQVQKSTINDQVSVISQEGDDGIKEQK